MILNRLEFIEYLQKKYPGSSIDFKDDSALWIPETQIKRGKKAKYFVVGHSSVHRDNFWEDIKNNCSGIVRCYVSEEDAGEWWGFTNKKDAFYFLLRWA